eukprot:5824262-Amphidinium_carterae.1
MVKTEISIEIVFLGPFLKQLRSCACYRSQLQSQASLFPIETFKAWGLRSRLVHCRILGLSTLGILLLLKGVMPAFVET